MNEPPEQIVPFDMETVGVGLTVTLLVAEFALTQPAVLVPITVYDVVEPGLTIAEPP